MMRRMGLTSSRSCANESKGCTGDRANVYFAGSVAAPDLSRRTAASRSGVMARILAGMACPLIESGNRKV
jgi:hypothetical protein